MPGHFELAILAAISRDELSAADICREMSARLKREVALGQLYPALTRLEGGKLIKSRTVIPEKRRGGRRRKLYSAEEAGKQALIEQIELLESLLKKTG